jgi:histidinol-phosphate aminotransferase
VAPRSRQAVEQLDDYDVADFDGCEAVVRGHLNENAFGAPPHVVAALRELSAADLARYPTTAYGELLERIAAHLAVEPKCVAAGNGADEVLSALIDAFAAPGNNVVIMQPSFGWYSRFAARSGVEVREIAYRDRWLVRADDIVARCDAGTRLVILGNPNNPTGDLLPSGVLLDVVRRLSDTLVVVDETYVELSGYSHASELDFRKNLAIVRSMSKVPALAGLRLGYVATTPEIAAAVRRWMQPFPVNAAAVAAALAYLSDGPSTEAFVTRYRSQVARSLAAIAAACGPIALAVYPSAANFILIDFGARAERVAGLFARRGICVRRYRSEDLRTCLRVTALDAAGTAAVVDALREASAGACDA